MKRVLVAPLDWGLGHAARCIPIIRLLLEKKCDVVLAGSGRSLEFLKLEFPLLATVHLEAYDPQYPKTNKMVAAMAMQLPKFLRTIRREHKQLEQIIQEQAIDVVISDNRFGCWTAHIPSVFITHQSNILMPKRFGWLAPVVRYANQRVMKKFSRCWIPDFPNEDSIAGALANPSWIKAMNSIRYIGLLSRFSRDTTDDSIKKYDLLCVFSGPEPQRSILEQIVLQEVESSGLRTAVVRGIPPTEKKKSLDTRAAVIDFASSVELLRLMQSSDVILARSGFSTVMDLAMLKKKAIFVPTPGQTEQEYLAKTLSAKGIARAVEQDQLQLRRDWIQAKACMGFTRLPDGKTLLNEALNEVLMI